jgi:hypothetical protein
MFELMDQLTDVSDFEQGEGIAQLARVFDA